PVPGVARSLASPRAAGGADMPSPGVARPWTVWPETGHGAHVDLSPRLLAPVPAPCLLAPVPSSCLLAPVPVLVPARTRRARGFYARHGFLEDGVRTVRPLDEA